MKANNGLLWKQAGATRVQHHVLAKTNAAAAGKAACPTTWRRTSQTVWREKFRRVNLGRTTSKEQADDIYNSTVEALPGSSIKLLPQPAVLVASTEISMANTCQGA